MLFAQTVESIKHHLSTQQAFVGFAATQLVSVQFKQAQGRKSTADWQKCQMDRRPIIIMLDKDEGLIFCFFLFAPTLCSSNILHPVALYLSFWGIYLVWSICLNDFLSFTIPNDETTTPSLFPVSPTIWQYAGILGRVLTVFWTMWIITCPQFELYFQQLYPVSLLFRLLFNNLHFLQYRPRPILNQFTKPTLLHFLCSSTFFISSTWPWKSSLIT